ncbi:SDR family oxidoreductase [Herbaspirillum sp. NPDC087042]|uniref:SDR family oxidoreductase n=1 Tax=Herbaspirillum sp. NPDC087042 TaxID=3364004 RepID=UPI0038022E96
MKDMKDTTIVVIGGLSGIGRATAEQAAAAGARVIAAGRRTPPADLPASITAAHVDISDDASVARLFDGIGPFDHLVVTAGPVIGSARLADLNIDDAIAAFNVKFFGQMRVAQHALRSIRHTGSITLTSGLLARKAAPGALVKASMNAATDIMAKTLAKELAPLRVNVVSPGMVETGMWGEMSEADRKAMAARAGAHLPVGRVGQGDDLAQAYLMLMQNGFMTGSVVDVDGGGLL